MQLGACGGFEQIPFIQRAGFDYIEMGAAGLLVPREDEAIFAENLQKLRAGGLPCPVVNCFIPGDLKIVGPEVDRQKLHAYAETLIRRAGEAGVGVIVFGSGGARNIPEGFERGLAWKQLREFCAFCAGVAEKHGVTIVLEPLNSKECNVLNSVEEGARLVREVGHESFRLLVDAYHWGLESEPMADISANAPLLRHVHVATWPGRLAPGREECALADFFRTLCEAGYNGRISFEGKVEDPQADLALAQQVMSDCLRSTATAR